MLPLLTWAYLRQYIAHHHHFYQLPPVLEQQQQQQQQYSNLSRAPLRNLKHTGFYHDVAIEQKDNQSYQCRFNNASEIWRLRPTASLYPEEFQPSVDQGNQKLLIRDKTEVVKLNYFYANGGSTFIMRFGDNSSKRSAIIEVSETGVVGTSCGNVPTEIIASDSSINDTVAGVVPPSGPIGSRDALSMNITPALSQVRSLIKNILSIIILHIDCLKRSTYETTCQN